MKTVLVAWLLTAFTTCLMAQTAADFPFKDISETPENYTPETLAVRMIQGLGFRYYWATEGLRPQDLAYRPTEEASSTLETLQHIYGLSNMIVQATKNESNVRVRSEDWDLEKLRVETLTNLETAIESLTTDPAPLAEREMIWGQGENRSTLPFWNVINGPLADAIYHTGQVVSFRRTSGNPLPKGVNVLTGTRRGQ
ncbi:MAG TPA: hypothetical protein DCP28_22150 [Cytophagales bacterium]|nr:hypothetical protein [Cytophagales bacterium]